MLLLEKHTEMEHKPEVAQVATDSDKSKPCEKSPESKRSTTCKNCGKIFVSQNEFEQHADNCVQSGINCDQCGYLFNDEKILANHLLQEHNKSSSDYFTCGFCDFKSFDMEVVDQHIVNVHQMYRMLDGLTTNQRYVSESLDDFKEEFMKVMKTVTEENIAMKQELFILRQMIQTILPNTKQDSKACPQETCAKVASASVPIPSSKPLISESNRNPQKAPRSKDDDKKSILMIGDSISNKLDIDIIEKATGGKIKMCKAYGAVFDNVGNEAKQAGRFPAKNFKDAIPVEVKKESFDYLMIQAGSTDISNLKTNENNIDVESFKKEVRYAAKNLFTAAEGALEDQPSIKKVVIMTMTPRYDARTSDPKSLKPILAQVFNNTLGELWLDSSMKDKVVIGLHNLECVGGVREARYRDTNNRKYDGIHLHGPSGGKAYTISVIDILKEFDITDDVEVTRTGEEYFKEQLQFQYQKPRRQRINRKPSINSFKCDADNDRDIRPRKHLNTQYQYQSQRYSVPTSNRYEYLNY